MLYAALRSGTVGMTLGGKEGQRHKAHTRQAKHRAGSMANRQVNMCKQLGRGAMLVVTCRMLSCMWQAAAAAAAAVAPAAAANQGSATAYHQLCHA
jgi:hypothetical protein